MVLSKYAQSYAENAQPMSCFYGNIASAIKYEGNIHSNLFAVMPNHIMNTCYQWVSIPKLGFSHLI